MLGTENGLLEYTPLPTLLFSPATVATSEIWISPTCTSPDRAGAAARRKGLPHRTSFRQHLGGSLPSEIFCCLSASEQELRYILTSSDNTQHIGSDALEEDHGPARIWRATATLDVRPGMSMRTTQSLPCRPSPPLKQPPMVEEVPDPCTPQTCHHQDR